MDANADTPAIALGSLEPRGTRRLIYNSDPSITTRHLSDPVAQPEELRRVVRIYASDRVWCTLSVETSM